MRIIEEIMQWGRGRGLQALYGTSEQINEMLQEVPLAGEVAMYVHLITDSETVDGRDRATVAVYFATLCDFDFSGEDLLPVQEMLRGWGKELLHVVDVGNMMRYSGVRWQYGYDDYAENVCWVCLRVTIEELAAECWPLKINDV